MTAETIVRLVAEYGYAATFAGMLLEGETFLVLSGLAASRGILDVPHLLAVGAAGAFFSDNLFFAAGRSFGPSLLARFPRLAPAAARADAIVLRLPNTAVIGIRFLYGMRAAGPAIIGSGSIPWWRFATLDALAASLWAACWTGAGYVLGESVEQLLGGAAQTGKWSVSAAVLGCAIVMLVRLRWRRKTARGGRSAQEWPQRWRKRFRAR